MVEFLLDPSIWIGLFSLILLEIVLGIDNLIFIAILADKLPPHQRDRARQVGLVLALVMRLGLLASISWLVTLTDPLFAILGKSFSGRDLILFVGGLFLLFKATMELHERLEGQYEQQRGPRLHASFGVVVAQIVVLDAVFSLDSVITAVGMVDHLAVMMIAVTVAIVIMLAASKPLTRFVNAHPTIVILCLGFLMMIGFALVADGLGFHIPKSYLYAAIGFSVLIEMLNQLAGANRRRQLAHPRRLRERTAEAVLKLLGGRHEDADPANVDPEDIEMATEATFKPVERHMIRSVLRLADAPIQAHMTPRPDIAWLDVEATAETVLAMMQAHPYSRFLVCEGELDRLLGVVQSRDMLAHALAHVDLNLRASLSQPLIVPELMSSLDVLEALRQHPVPMAVVIDEYGGVLGVVTTGDLLAAIAGELIDTADPQAPQIVEDGDGNWLLDGGLPLDQVSDLLGIVIADTEYYTLAGLVLAHLQRVPAVGDQFELDGYRFETAATEGHRIQRVRVVRLGSPLVGIELAEGRG